MSPALRPFAFDLTIDLFCSTVNEMAVRDILIWPHPKLSEISSSGRIDHKNLAKLVVDLTDTMRSREGAGIAAPQIGVPVGVFLIAPWVAEISGPDPLVFIDPEIVWVSEETVREKEGCLSFPDIWVLIERPAECKIRATGLDGKPFAVAAKGLYARALQHERDHLDGTLMIDLVGHLKKDMIRKRMKKKRKKTI